ncbi:MAG: DNA gyrase inhibitor YacG [Bdellovibrionales bacterium]
MKVKCPTCGKPSRYDKDNPDRPFCSERCRVLDLGAWADEKYRVPLDNSQESSAIQEKSENQPSKDDLN